MRRLDRFQTRVAQVRMNLTPLIDMAFLLIVFFVLTSQLTSVESAQEIELPEPKNAVSVPAPDEHRLILNLIPDPVDPSRIAVVRAGYHEFSVDSVGRSALRDDLASAHRADPELKVDVRADRRAAYAQVFPILDAAVKAGISQVDLVVNANTSGKQNEEPGAGSEAPPGG